MDAKGGGGRRKMRKKMKSLKFNLAWLEGLRGENKAFFDLSLIPRLRCDGAIERRH